jgi:uncharacterized cupin superfamily protein
VTSRHVVHWDDVPEVDVDRHGLRARWTNLGEAAGSVNVGVRRQRIAAGDRPTPPHVHGAEEEIVYVLAGSGLSWQGRVEGETYEIRPGDCIVHRRTMEAHTLIGGPDGLEVLVYGTRVAVEAGLLPSAGIAWLGPSWTEVGGPHPWARAEQAGPPVVPAPTTPRPSTIVNVEDVADDVDEHGAYASTERDLARAAGSELTGLRFVTVPPGKINCPHHCHSAEEEIFVVLEGSGVCVLGDEEHPVWRGSVVSRPPATRIAHSFRAGADGLTYLAYGTREPNDICYYPRSGKVYLRGVGVMGRIEPLDYWDGE